MFQMSVEQFMRTQQRLWFTLTFAIIWVSMLCVTVYATANVPYVDTLPHIVLLVVSLLTTAIAALLLHEAAHWLGARALGLDARFTTVRLPSKLLAIPNPAVAYAPAPARHQLCIALAPQALTVLYLAVAFVVFSQASIAAAFLTMAVVNVAGARFDLLVALTASRLPPGTIMDVYASRH